MAVAAVQNDIAAGLTGSGAASTAKSATTEMSDRFLTLLVTQLKNQDPMNPMENAELTSQLAEMSTVEGITKLNETMDGLVSQYRASQVLQGAALVGRQVLAEGDRLQLTSAGAAAAVSLDSSASSVQIKVLDANNNVVQTLSLGPQDAGLVRFAWDGKDAVGTALPEGDYRFTAEAMAGESKLATTTYALGSVLSVSLNDSDMEAEISGIGARSLGQIKQIF